MYGCIGFSLECICKSVNIIILKSTVEYAIEGDIESVIKFCSI